MRAFLSQPEDAEDGAQQVFTKVFEALPRYERRAQPFRAWLFVVVRNHALNEIERQRRIETLDMAELSEHQERQQERAGAAEEPSIVGWITDRELLLFIERLPLAQRQVLLLRYMLDLSYDEIAHLLGRTPEAMRRMHSRALTYLRGRLSAVGRAPEPQRPGRRSTLRRADARPARAASR